MSGHFSTRPLCPSSGVLELVGSSILSYISVSSVSFRISSALSSSISVSISLSSLGFGFLSSWKSRMQNTTTLIRVNSAISDYVHLNSMLQIREMTKLYTITHEFMAVKTTALEFSTVHTAK